MEIWSLVKHKFEIFRQKEFYCTCLKIKLLYWYHEESLTSMESFHYTLNVLYSYKQFFILLKCFFHTKKNGSFMNFN